MFEIKEGDYAGGFSAAQLSKMDDACPGNTSIADACTGACVEACPDGSRPVNGKCPGCSTPAECEVACVTGTGVNRTQMIVGGVVLAGLAYLLLRRKKGGRRR